MEGRKARRPLMPSGQGPVKRPQVTDAQSVPSVTVLDGLADLASRRADRLAVGILRQRAGVLLGVVDVLGCWPERARAAEGVGSSVRSCGRRPTTGVKRLLRADPLAHAMR